MTLSMTTQGDQQFKSMLNHLFHKATEEERGKVLWEAWEATTYSQRTIVEFVDGLSEGAGRGMMYRHRLTMENRLPVERPDVFDVQITLEPPFDIVGDAIVVGDVHVPCTDVDMARRVYPLAERQGINTLIVAGDLFNNDFATRHEKRNLSMWGWDRERAAAKVLLEEWTSFFDHVYLFAGNHDRWFTGKLDGQVGIKDLIDMVHKARNLHVSEYGYMDMLSGEEEWMIAHGSNYSQNALTVAHIIANKHQKHVWTQHQHHMALGLDRWKHYWTVDGPALVDPMKLSYVQMDASRSAGMAVGFGMIKRGKPYLFGNDKFTDWSMWLDDRFVIDMPSTLRVPA